MRRKDREITEREKIDSILYEAEICRLAMVDGGEPYIVPVNFGYDGRCIYFHSAKTGRKIDILKANGTVCFEAETGTELKKDGMACEWGMRFYSAIGTGKAEFIEGFEEKVKALDIIMRKYSRDDAFKYDAAQVERVAVVKIEIKEVTGKKSGY